jgi:hypothetical protein
VRLGGDANPARVRITTIDRQTSFSTADLSVCRGPPQSHLVLSEVYANPLGTEPAQEWVELFNDGSGAVPLGGCTLQDGGGSIVLPDATVGAGAYALIVNGSFALDDGADPPPAAGTLVVRVASLSLSNEGEALTLRDPGGVVMSRFPAMKPKSGVSIVRLVPDALDEDPASFAPSPNGSATPGAPN